MIQEEVILSSIYIKRIGESHFFQVQLPRDTKRVIGLECSASGKYGELLASPAEPVDYFHFLPNKVVGKLTLKAAGCEGIFYQGDVVEDRSIHFGETTAPVIWQPKPWTHGRKRQEIGVSVKENSVIHGLFQDSWGAGEYETLEYKLNLYLWIEKCAA